MAATHEEYAALKKEYEIVSRRGLDAAMIRRLKERIRRIESDHPMVRGVWAQLPPGKGNLLIDPGTGTPMSRNGRLITATGTTIPNDGRPYPPVTFLGARMSRVRVRRKDRSVAFLHKDSIPVIVRSPVDVLVTEQDAEDLSLLSGDPIGDYISTADAERYVAKAAAALVHPFIRQIASAMNLVDKSIILSISEIAVRAVERLKLYFDSAYDTRHDLRFFDMLREPPSPLGLLTFPSREIVYELTKNLPNTAVRRDQIFIDAQFENDRPIIFIRLIGDQMPGETSPRHTEYGLMFESRVGDLANRVYTGDRLLASLPVNETDIHGDPVLQGFAIAGAVIASILIPTPVTTALNVNVAIDKTLAQGEQEVGVSDGTDPNAFNEEMFGLLIENLIREAGIGPTYKYAIAARKGTLSSLELKRILREAGERAEPSIKFLDETSAGKIAINTIEKTLTSITKSVTLGRTDTPIVLSGPTSP